MVRAGVNERMSIMNRRKYTSPEMDVLVFEDADVICWSIDDGSGNDFGDDGDTDVGEE